MYPHCFFLRSCICASWVASVVCASSASSDPSWQLPSAKFFGIPGLDASFDYIVIGGGTAGLTVASRLASARRFTVAVIEGGGFYEQDNGNLSTVPAYCVAFAGTAANDTNPLVDWNFITVPQAGLNGRRLHYARGKTLGGTSARNFMAYHRPTTGSMQQWASAVGNDAFTFSRLLPWYKKSPHYTSPPFPFPNSTNDQDPNAFNAKGGGPLQISFGGYVDPFGTWAQYALKAAGQKLIRGFQSGTLIGTSYCPFTIDPITAQRSSSESSFLQSVTTQSSYRINASTQWLTLYNNTLAERILFDGSRKTTGVRVSSGSTCYTLSARKEIILSAGVFQSPQLLMVSGIGGRQQLETHNIPLIQDLPGVGQNMWDHILFGTSYPVNVPTASAGLNNSTLEAAAVQAYNQAASGPLSIPVSGVLGWEKLPQPYRSRLTHFSQQTLARSFSKDWPELELLIVSGYIGYQRNLATSDPLDGNNYATIGTALVAPLSRGNVTLSSPRMADAPLINPNWLTHPTDIELAILAFKRGRAVWSALQDANLTTGSEKLPGAAVQTDEEILDFIRASLSPVWHAAGTCKMGRRGDGRAVVDSKHRVFGVRGLRVVDASVFPLLPPGHPQGTIYALAERVAGLLLEEGEEDEEGKEEASKEKYMRGKGRDGLIQD